MRSILSTIKHILRKHGLTEQLDEIEIIGQYSKIFPDLISLHSRPLKLENGILFVKVDNGVIRHEMKLQETAMIQSINDKIKKNAVRKIRLH